MSKHDHVSDFLLNHIYYHKASLRFIHDHRSSLLVYNILYQLKVTHNQHIFPRVRYREGRAVLKIIGICALTFAEKYGVMRWLHGLPPVLQVRWGAELNMMRYPHCLIIELNMATLRCFSPDPCLGSLEKISSHPNMNMYDFLLHFYRPEVSLWLDTLFRHSSLVESWMQTLEEQDVYRELTWRNPQYKSLSLQALAAELKDTGDPLELDERFSIWKGLYLKRIREYQSVQVMNCIYLLDGDHPFRVWIEDLPEDIYELLLTFL